MNARFRWLTLTLCIALLPVQAYALEEARIPSNASPFYYVIGGGQSLPRPAAGFQTTRLRSTLRAGLGYNCGQFNFAQNLAQMINQFNSKARQLPGQMTGAVQAAVLGLAGYLLNKANPALYNVVTKTLNESADLFRLGVKSCQQIERDTRQGRDPYKTLVTASVADRWQVNAGTGELTVDLARQDTMENAADNGVVLADGQRYGGLNQPVASINENVAIVGYNTLLGRALTDRSAPVGDAAEASMVKLWPTPQAAADWIASVAGSYTSDLTENGESAAQAGRGLKPGIDTLTQALRIALDTAVREDDYTLLREVTVMQIGPSVINAIRDADPFDASIMMDRLAIELAAAELQNQTLIAERILYAGLASPHLVQSTAQSAVNERIRMQTLPDLRAALDEVHRDLDLRQKTLTRTTSVILQYRGNEAAGNAGAPGVTQTDTNPVIDGNVIAP